MKERIKHIIETENVSYTKFADMLGIQRSGISHIVNGRNNPSLEIIQKILEKFEYINTDWLLFGKGPMKKANFIEKQTSLFDENIIENTEEQEITENKEKINSISEQIIEDNTEVKKILHSPEDKISKKIIERVLIFYSDNSFKEYLPE